MPDNEKPIRLSHTVGGKFPVAPYVNVDLSLTVSWNEETIDDGISNVPEVSVEMQETIGTVLLEILQNEDFQHTDKETLQARAKTYLSDEIQKMMKLHLFLSPLAKRCMSLAIDSKSEWDVETDDSPETETD